jgi:hypothetical protein
MASAELGFAVKPAVPSCSRLKPSDFGTSPLVSMATPTAVAVDGADVVTDTFTRVEGSKIGSVVVR